MILLDTHSAIWFVAGNAALGHTSLALAREARSSGQLAISAISFWEIAMLIGKGRLQALTPAVRHRERILSAGIREVPLTGDIALLAVELTGLHPDPADRFIAATAVAHDAALITADTRLLRWRNSVKRQDASK